MTPKHLKVAIEWLKMSDQQDHLKPPAINSVVTGIGLLLTSVIVLLLISDGPTQWWIILALSPLAGFLVGIFMLSNRFFNPTWRRPYCRFPHETKTHAVATVYTIRGCGHQLTEIPVCQRHIVELHALGGISDASGKCDICKQYSYRQALKVNNLDTQPSH